MIGSKALGLLFKINLFFFAFALEISKTIPYMISQGANDGAIKFRNQNDTSRFKKLQLFYSGPYRGLRPVQIVMLRL